MEGSARDFGTILRDIGCLSDSVTSLCRQLADAHERDLKALQIKLVAPPPSSPHAVEDHVRMEEIRSSDSGDDSGLGGKDCMEEICSGDVGSAVPEPGSETLRLAAADTSVLARRAPPTPPKKNTWLSDGSLDVQVPTHSTSVLQIPIHGSTTHRGTKSMQKLFRQASVSIRDRKERLSDDLHLRRDLAEHADLKVFEARGVWNMNDEDMLRIKMKAREDNLSIDHPAERKSAQMSSHLDMQWDWFMIHPQSNGRLFWDFAGILWLGFDIIMLPLQVFPLPQSTFVDVMNILSNTYWTADMGASFLTGTYDKSVIVMTLRKVAKRYVSGPWFVFDLFLVLIGWAISVMETVSNMGSMQMARALRTARFLRVLRYLRLARLLRMVRGIQIFANLQQRFHSESGLFAMQVFKLMVSVVVMSHLLACVWYGIGNVPEGWVRVENHGLNGDQIGITMWAVGDQYLYTYQWSLSRLHPSTIEKNLVLRTTNERIFAIMGGLCAMVVGAAIISTVTNLMREFQEKHKRRKHNLALVQTYVSKYKISPGLAVRAKRYIDFEHEAKVKSQREAELLTILPHDMVLDFQYEAFSPVLFRHEFFNELHQKHLRTHYDICHKAMTGTTVLSQEVVFTAGDACNRMSFVTTGKFTYTLKNLQASKKTFEAAKHHPTNSKHTMWSVSEEPDDVQVVDVGVGLSEAVLWTPWEHRGEFYSEKGGTVLVVMVDAFVDVLLKHEQALAATSIHARCFIDELNAVSLRELTDLPSRVKSGCVLARLSETLPRQSSRDKRRIRQSYPDLFEPDADEA